MCVCVCACVCVCVCFSFVCVDCREHNTNCRMPPQSPAKASNMLQSKALTLCCSLCSSPSRILCMCCCASLHFTQHTHTYTHTYTHMRTHTYTHIHTHTHTHTPAPLTNPCPFTHRHSDVRYWNVDGELLQAQRIAADLEPASWFLLQWDDGPDDVALADLSALSESHPLMSREQSKRSRSVVLV